MVEIDSYRWSSNVGEVMYFGIMYVLLGINIKSQWDKNFEPKTLTSSIVVF